MAPLDRFLGRAAPPEPALDRLFGLLDAAVTLEAATGFVPTGAGAVCHRLVEGGAFGGARRDVERLLAADGPETEVTEDPYGHCWIRARRDPGALARLVGDLHLVNSTLEAAGFGAYLLCSVVGFRRAGAQRLIMVHLQGRGTFYPFAPRPPAAGAEQERHRTNAVERNVREAVEGELPVEQDTGRWFPLWDAPAL